MATLYMLTESSHSQKMGFVLRTEQGKIAVIDGGTRMDGEDLLTFLQSLTGSKTPHVDLWILTHCHTDHIGALCEITEQHPGSLSIGTLCHKLLSRAFVEEVCGTCGDPDLPVARDWADALTERVTAERTFTPTNGQTIRLDECTIRVLSVPDETIRVNPSNNSSLVFRLDVGEDRVLFTGDLGIEGGRACLERYGDTDELRAGYCQMAHHGQNGVEKSFYAAVGMHTCLWCTPLWLWNNDAGKGFDTHVFQTVRVREWMEELGVQTHLCTFDGTKTILLG